MKKTMIAGVVLASMLFASQAMAHVTNEKTLYDDIALSKAKEQIVYLRGASAITAPHGATVFKPGDKLSRAELAYWSGNFAHLKDGGTEDELKKAALDKKLVSSLDGNATYKEVAQAYFGGKVTPEKPDAELTKEEFALYLGKYLTEKADGKTILDMAGLAPGPTGTVESVSSKKEGAGDKAYDVFSVVVGGKEYQIGQHPKVLYAATDLKELKGKKIEESWVKDESGKPAIEILKAEKGQTPTDNGAQANADQHHDDHDVHATESKSFPVVPVVGGAALVAVLGWLFFRKKK